MLSTSCLYFLSTWPYVPQHPCRLLRWRYWQTRARGLICLCLQAPVTLPSLENLCYKRKASGHLTSRMLGNHQWHIFISGLPMYSTLSCLRHRWALPYELAVGSLWCLLTLQLAYSALGVLWCWITLQWICFTVHYLVMVFHYAFHGFLNVENFRIFVEKVKVTF